MFGNWLKRREVEQLVGELRRGDSRARLRAMTRVQMLLPSLLEQQPSPTLDALIAALVELFADPDTSVAGTAGLTLGRAGQAAVPAVAQTLSHPTPMARYLALGTLRHLDRQRGRDAALRALDDPDEEVRWCAASLVGDLRDKRAVERLRELQVEPSERVRAAAEASLRELGVLPKRAAPRERPGRHVLRLYADYHQFYVGDATFEADTDSATFWSSEAHGRRLAVSPPCLISVGTVRYDYVPVVLDIDEAPPEELGDWDHIVEASLFVPSGRIAVDGCLSYTPEPAVFPGGPPASQQIEVAPGMYRVRVNYGGLDTLDDDHYHLVLWPVADPEYSSPIVLRAKPPSG